MSISKGQILEGTVTGITKFGAFVELSTGETGLVHISEVADSYVNDVNEFLKVNDTVKVKGINEKSKLKNKKRARNFNFSNSLIFDILKWIL